MNEFDTSEFKRSSRFNPLDRGNSNQMNEFDTSEFKRSSRFNPLDRGNSNQITHIVRKGENYGKKAFQSPRSGKF